MIAALVVTALIGSGGIGLFVALYRAKAQALEQAVRVISELRTEIGLWPQRLKDERSSLEAALRVVRSERDHYSTLYSDIAVVAAKESPAALRAFVAERLLRATKTAGEADPRPEAGLPGPAPTKAST